MALPSILLIDDEEIMRDVISTLLEREGYRVFTAATGDDGLKILELEPVDLVVLDLMLPGKSGLDTLKEMMETDSDLVVIMISA